MYTLAKKETQKIVGIGSCMSRCLKSVKGIGSCKNLYVPNLKVWGKNEEKTNLANITATTIDVCFQREAIKGFLYLHRNFHGQYNSGPQAALQKVGTSLVVFSLLKLVQTEIDLDPNSL